MFFNGILDKWNLNDLIIISHISDLLFVKQRNTENIWSVKKKLKTKKLKMKHGVRYILDLHLLDLDLHVIFFLVHTEKTKEGVSELAG